MGLHHLQWAPEMLLRTFAILLILLGFTASAWAEDWIATKLRGMAEVQIDDVWLPLARGDSVVDDQLVRTLGDSRLELTRGVDVIALGPDTQLRIADDAATRFTVVHQDFGTVEVEAQVRDTKHLEVRTKFLAAVVKGTHFIVTAGATGASVEVTRGLVAVQSFETRQFTEVPAGNTARVAALSGLLEVSGASPLPAIRTDAAFELPTALPSLPDVPALPTTGAAAPAATLATGTQGVQIAQSGPAAGLGLSLQLPTSELGAAASEPIGVDLWTTALGVAIGIAMGAIALLLRRLFP